MPSSLSVNAFIARSGAYVRANAERANVNGNAYLTKTEGKKLPADLRDNFEAHRVGAQANASVRVEKFIERYTNYVAMFAREADTNADGRLTRAEAKNLPVDLQDNFANALAAR